MAEDVTGETSDPSMEDILSSIRRILNEEKGETEGGVAPPELLLDATMLAEPEADPPRPGLEEETMPETLDAPQMVAPPDAESAVPTAASGLASVETGRRVAAMLGGLAEARAVALGKGGLTLEDLVREALRPMLQQWLDQYLPGLVERLVREELARIGGTAGL